MSRVSVIVLAHEMTRFMEMASCIREKKHHKQFMGSPLLCKAQKTVLVEITRF